MAVNWIIKLLAVTSTWRVRKKEGRYMEMERGIEISLPPRHDETWYLDWRACKLNLGNEKQQSREEEKERAAMQKSCCVFTRVRVSSYMRKGVGTGDKLQSWHFFAIISLQYEEFEARFRARAGETLGTRKAWGSEVVERVGKGWAGWSPLPPGWRWQWQGWPEGWEGGRAGGLPTMGDAGARAGQAGTRRNPLPTGLLVFIILTTGEATWNIGENGVCDLLVWMLKASRVSGETGADLILSSYAVLDLGCRPKCTINTVTFMFQYAKSKYTFNGLEESVEYSKSEEIWSQKSSLKVTLSCWGSALGGEGEDAETSCICFFPLPFSLCHVGHWDAVSQNTSHPWMIFKDFGAQTPAIPHLLPLDRAFEEVSAGKWEWVSGEDADRSFNFVKLILRGDM